MMTLDAVTLAVLKGRLEQIAEELGLTPFVNYIKPAKGYRKVWHTTVANMKSTN